jgi:hypothetical protein
MRGGGGGHLFWSSAIACLRATTRPCAHVDHVVTIVFITANFFSAAAREMRRSCSIFSRRLVAAPAAHARNPKRRSLRRLNAFEASLGTAGG